MSISLAAGIAAGVVDGVGFYPYIRSILRGQTKPNRASFAIWAVVGTVIVISYISAGATTTIWLPLIYTLLGYTVFALSFKYGVGGFNLFDLSCLSVSFIGIMLWVLTKNPLTALYSNVGAEAVGYLPTIKKVYSHPKTENTLAWTMAAVASVINLAAITSFSLRIILYPIMLLVSNGVLATLLLWPKFRLRHSS